HLLLPLFVKDNQLFIATPEPFEDTVWNQIKFNARMPVVPVLVEYSKIIRIRAKWLNSSVQALSDSLNIKAEEYVVAEDTASFTLTEERNLDSEAPIVRFLNRIISAAIEAKASDIHFEPYDKHFRVRFRIDGLLRDIFSPPSSWSSRIASRVKIMADLDITERRIPQDGRIRVSPDGRNLVDLRVNTLPLQFGEKIVMRILDASMTTLGIDELGYEDDQRVNYLTLLNKPQGMILVTGPTGSGKTVSLYTGLGILNTDERNISTAEDPVEINISGINQTQINSKAGYDFPTAMRAFLRQDPDVIMVGEIRDLETAEIAVKAAQTGHLVLSTLHTNSSTETLNRLLNMGLSTFNVATSVSLIIAQRLARKLCTNCRQTKSKLPAEVLREEGLTDIGIDSERFTLFEAVGCDQCVQGYSGRVGIYETLVITPEISSVILSGGSATDILHAAKQQGFRTMRTSALRKVVSGIISMEEANRITTN
ncbi:MAG: ATPase, T2SS/T4P/T4SS family, partial [Porticoccaceae bacterium]|nr:ATPase, T2SS/T4P/T4SS family [Porticoccaceae bacterium]